MIDRQDWSARGACRGEDPELFWPIGSGIGVQAQIAAAKRVCARCPVRRGCREHALAKPEEAGIWGGLTEDERQRLRRPAPDLARVAS